MRLFDPPAKDRAPSRSGLVGQTRAHVLIVDDEPQLRDLLTDALTRDGFRVSACADGPEALRRIGEGDVEVLLTDLRMPAMDGLELIQRARKLAPGLGCVLVTAFASTETAVQALRHGADDYLIKPFALDDLRQVVRRVLRLRRLVCAQQDADARAHSEAATLRQRSRRAERELEQARHDLDLSRRDLQRRVRDLEFIGELTTLLAREGDMERILRTTASILATRFQSRVVRIELDVGEGVQVAEQSDDAVLAARLASMGAELMHTASRRSNGLVKDVVLGFGRPLEALSTVVRRNDRVIGGLAMLREPMVPSDDAGDRALLSMVPQALGVAIEADVNRRAAERSALRVAASIVETLERRGSLFQGHADRVARIALRMCDQADVSPRMRRAVDMAARLHDVGKVSLPDGVLQRPGPLTGREREVLRLHPAVGARILAPFGEAAAYVRHHRERPDGTGYPDGLHGDDIPLGAGIVGLAAAYEAMTSPRPYRTSRRRRPALAEVRAERGKQFVSGAVDALLRIPGSGL